MKKSSFSIIGILLVGVVLASIGFVEYRSRYKNLAKVVINIQSREDTSHFIAEADILNLLKEKSGYNLDNIRAAEIDKKSIEKLVGESNFVEACQASVDIRGNLVLDITENRPVARIVFPDGSGFYITPEGKKLPLSKRFSPRVLIIQGDGAGMLKNASYWLSLQGADFLKMLNYITKEPFWKMQIAELEIDRFGNVFAYPQAGDEVFELGKADNFEAKLNKIKLFYSEIAARKGWQTYKQVNVKFSNQIICK